MFTATVINPAATYIADFVSLEAAEEWAFGVHFVRGVSRVEIRDPLKRPARVFFFIIFLS